MTSKAEASFVCKSFGANLLPDKAPEVGVKTVLKKKQGDATLSLELNDATLRDPKSLKGLALVAEKPLGSGVKGELRVVPASKDVLGVVSIDKKWLDNDVTLKLAYLRSTKGDVVTIEETWKFDKQNKLVGRYNFAKEEAVFKYEHTRGSLKMAAEYNMQAEKALVSAEKKRGKNTFAASYGVQDQAATLSWTNKPLKVVVRGKAGSEGVKGVQATLLVTKEFEL
ncbi:outer envelope pore chloroplastic [Chlorella sorokiniana]|uniref:Outer envelope pore chloroplastic n=1 Tax=Chlorella sorokiniana TaxID=3076 RepID=A0A2P6TYS4_CHLSO|nr:outer envelope pore chloroplastic [Chlorella sorokiniana]|eukprot:PRW59190.1 outer envelope pore chloroplastic [Chlorella sorokiniana]